MTDVDVSLDAVESNSVEYDLARGLAVGTVVLCWCMVCVAVRKIHERKRKLKDAADRAEVAVVV